MRFNDIIKSILKEDKKSQAVLVTGGRLLRSGKVLEDENYLLEQPLPGTIPEVMLNVLEDVVRKLGKKVEDCESVQILVDDVDSPMNCSLYFGWNIESDTFRTVFCYVGLDTKVTGSAISDEVPLKYSKTHNISLDHLRKLQQDKIWKDSMKGHELEDLYNL